MRKIILTLMLMSLALGCIGEPTCEQGETLVDGICCVDADNSGICDSSETTTTSTTTSTTSSTTSTTTTTTSTTTTTTTLRYLQVEWSDISKCRHTTIGNMNTFYMDIPNTIDGVWGNTTVGKVSYICDGGEQITADILHRMRVGTINRGENISGQYKVMAKCGRNSQTLDLNDCENLTVYFDTGIF